MIKKVMNLILILCFFIVIPCCSSDMQSGSEDNEGISIKETPDIYAEIRLGYLKPYYTWDEEISVDIYYILEDTIDSASLVIANNETNTVTICEDKVIEIEELGDGYEQKITLKLDIEKVIGYGEIRIGIIGKDDKGKIVSSSNKPIYYGLTDEGVFLDTNTIESIRLLYK